MERKEKFIQLVRRLHAKAEQYEQARREANLNQNPADRHPVYPEPEGEWDRPRNPYGEH